MKGFFAGFVVTGLFIVLANIGNERETPHPRLSGSPPTEKITSAARGTISGPSFSYVALVDCQRQLQALLPDGLLKFDTRSETLKAELRQVLFAVIEIAADCPESRLEIVATLSDSMSEYRRELTHARMNSLREQFMGAGLSAEKKNSLPTDGQLPGSLTLRFAGEPLGPAVDDLKRVNRR